ncbi:MAG TPA: hypothetical protein VFR85_10120 [Anaeromyxobacteraceae bacterium]|nr:hypothetical protein [Anaeromyxobacteraceae bacterium]
MARLAITSSLLAVLVAACSGPQRPGELLDADLAPTDRITGLSCPPCPLPSVCIDDPRDGCDPDFARCPGVCVAPAPCGGIARIACPAGQTCVDDPRDDCAPPDGADCAGLCVPAK